MAANTLVFTLLSGLVLLGIVALVLRLRGWRHVRVGAAAPTSVDAALARFVRSPTTWTAAFAVVVLVAVAGSLAVVGALPVPAGAQGTVTTALLALGGLLLGGFVFGGVYGTVRSRGHGSAPAVGLGSLAVGLLALLVVVVTLFLG